MADQLETKVLTPPFRASYAHVWEKHEDQHGNLKFSVAMIFPQTEDDSRPKSGNPQFDISAVSDLAGIKKAIMNCLVNKYGEDQTKWGKEAKKAYESRKELLMEGNEERPDDVAYTDSMFLSAKSDNKVGVVDANVQPIIDQEEFYSGCWAVATIRFYIPKKFPRVCCALNNVMKLADDESLSSGSKAEDDFSDFAGNESAGDGGGDSGWMD